MVLHWCRGFHLREQDMQDVFQEVFQAVAAHVPRFRKQGSADTFRGWLRTITRNKIQDHFRRRDPDLDGVGGTAMQMRLSQVPAPATAEDPSPADDAAERSLFALGLEFIRAEFAERTWQAFWQTAVLGRNAADVAADLAMHAGAVRVAKCRVLRRLREELGDLMDE
jgi:RNA polymerase sigma-70 factor (ECF subfamily)